MVAPSAGPDKQHTQPTTSLLLVSRPIFTARRYASAVHAMALCLYPCLSVTSRFSAKMTQRRCTITVPHNRSGTLMPEISRRSTAGYGGAKCRCGGLKWRLSTNNWLYLENGTRYIRRAVSIKVGPVLAPGRDVPLNRFSISAL